MAKTKSVTKVWQVTPYLECVNCQTRIPIEQVIPENFFRERFELCASCKKPLNWWDVMLAQIREKFPFGMALMPVGARWTACMITLRRGQTFTLRLSDYDVPVDARILSITYTPQGRGLFPLEMSGNTPLRHIIPTSLTLYPMPAKGIKNTRTKCAVLVVWIPRTEGNEAWQNLVDAFEAYEQNRFESSLIPANSAVESLLNRLLSDFL